MKLTTSTLMRILALYIGVSNVAAYVREDLGDLEIGEMDENSRVSEDGTEVFFKSKAGSRIERPIRCISSAGFQLTWSRDRKFVACCAPGQVLVGSADTNFACCGEGHDLAGDKTVGFSCCPTGHKYDGKKCVSCEPEPPVCRNGRVLKDGMCVCPSNTYERDGVCVPKCPSGTTEKAGVCTPSCPSGTVERDGVCTPQKPQGECSSGISAGKCYTWTFPNGERFGYNANGWYTASKESRHQQFGKFKLCKDENCLPGAINPGEGFSALDIHGQANGGANPNQWIDGKTNGGHVGKTPDYAKSGRFTITKWPCGKYCLGGFNSGLGPTCPSDLPAATFTTMDKQSCIPIDVLEVPCDIHNVANNCIWHNGADRCCDKVDCSAGALSRVPAAEKATTYEMKSEL